MNPIRPVTDAFIGAFNEAERQNVIVYVDGTGGPSRLSLETLTFVLREPPVDALHQAVTGECQ